MIYLDDDVFDKLKDQPNASGLINCLLADHFKTNTSNKESLIKAKEIIKEEASKFVELKEKEIEKIEKQIEKVSEEGANAEAIAIIQEQKNNDKIANCILSTQEVFGVNLTAEEAEEYIKGRWENIKEYLIEKNLL